MAFGEKSNDVNYWPSISDMFLVFFIMAMAIVITSSSSNEIGDKYLVDDVVREYEIIVAQAGRLSGSPVDNLHYLPKGETELTDKNDPEPQSSGRVNLCEKIINLLEFMEQHRLFHHSSRLKNASEFPKLIGEDGKVATAEYPFPVEGGNLSGAYALAKARCKAAGQENTAEVRYDEALRLLAFRALGVGQSTLSKLDAASMAREIRVAFSPTKYGNMDDLTASLTIATAEVRTLQKLLDECRCELDDVKKRLQKKEEENAQLKARVKELEAQLPAGGPGSPDAILSEILEILKDVPGVADTSSPQEVIRKLVEQIIDIENSNLYTESLQEDDVAFDYNSDRPKVRPMGQKKLAELIRVLRRKTAGDSDSVYEIIIVGHTDHKGQADRNLELGMERAIAIRDSVLRALSKEEHTGFAKASNTCSYGNKYVKFYCYSGSYYNALMPTAAQTECAANRRVEVMVSRPDKEKSERIKKQFEQSKQWGYKVIK